MRKLAIAASLILPVLLGATAAIVWWMWPSPTGPTIVHEDQGLVVVSADPSRPIHLETPAERPDPPEVQHPKSVPLTPDEEKQLEREGLKAITDLTRGKTVDPEALDGLNDVEGTDILKAALAGALQRDLDDHIDKGGFVKPQWDGKSELVCMSGDKFLIRDMTIEVEDTAITTMYGCQLHLLNCTVTAGTVVQSMMHSEVTIEGGTMKPSEHLVHNMFGKISVVGVTVEGEPEVAVVADGGRIDIVDSKLRGKTAISANQEARVHVEGGEVIGTTTSIEAKNGAVVDLKGTRREGKLEQSLKGRVEETAK